MRGKEKVTLSHWIDFFSGNIHKNENKILLSITVLISLIALLFIIWTMQWSMMDNYELIMNDQTFSETFKQKFVDLNENLYQFRNIILGFVGFFTFIPIMFYIDSNYRISKRLLNEVLESDDFIDLKYLRSEWINKHKIKKIEKIENWFKKRFKK